MNNFEDAVPNLNPGETCDVTSRGHKFRITATTQTGFHSDRRRYRVECLSCELEVHKATTGPWQQIDFHLREAAATATLHDDRAAQLANAERVRQVVKQAIIEFTTLDDLTDRQVANIATRVAELLAVSEIVPPHGRKHDGAAIGNCPSNECTIRGRCTYPTACRRTNMPHEREE